MVAGTLNYQNPYPNPNYQYSRVKDLALPPKYNRDNPFGHDIVVLRLKKRFLEKRQLELFLELENLSNSGTR